MELLYEDHDHTQMMNCHEESCSVKFQLQHEQEVINLTPEERDNMRRISVCGEGGRACRSLKWTPSKIRLMGKMMNSHRTESEIQIDDTILHEIEDQKLRLPHQCSLAVRVCADCNTTKTPLWRSGPRGPKSLCNACGIRRMTARRAAMAAKSPHLSAETSVTKTKKTRGRSNNCHAQMKKRSMTVEEEKQYFERIIRSLNEEDIPSLQKPFLRRKKRLHLSSWLFLIALFTVEQNCCYQWSLLDQPVSWAAVMGCYRGLLSWADCNAILSLKSLLPLQKLLSPLESPSCNLLDSSSSSLVVFFSLLFSLI